MSGGLPRIMVVEQGVASIMPGNSIKRLSIIKTYYTKYWWLSIVDLVSVIVPRNLAYELSKHTWEAHLCEVRRILRRINEYCGA
jgi:hypothetical protein